MILNTVTDLLIVAGMLYYVNTSRVIRRSHELTVIPRDTRS